MNEPVELLAAALAAAGVFTAIVASTVLLLPLAVLLGAALVTVRLQARR